ncbi:hypothetical protein, partial [Xanthomonas translucens]|uniref:hypothetical protein n=1 Tax=Xanthomonas campestris pv. translucens TaxID=343 RepID=UPI001E503A85
MNWDIDNPGWNYTALMLITPPRRLSGGASLYPAWRRSCDYWLRVRANQVFSSNGASGIPGAVQLRSPGAP